MLLLQMTNVFLPLVGKAGRAVQTLGISRHYELMYNMGLQLLHCQQPAAAFDCLMETINMYRINPRLWLRIAECCIMAHKAVSHILFVLYFLNTKSNTEVLYELLS